MNLLELEAANRRVDRHNGCDREWLERYTAFCRMAAACGRRGIELVSSDLVSRTADVRNLREAWKHVRRRSGTTSGPDGITAADFTEREQCDFLRRVREELLAEPYIPGGFKKYRRPKYGGDFRTIYVPDFIDRVIQRAIVQSAQPLLNVMFTADSFGYRPLLSRFHALARAKREIRQGNSVVIAEDLRDAFGSVPPSRTLQLVASYLPGPLVDLIRPIVQRPGIKGLPQGGSVSPLLLNLSCHHHFDFPWARVHGMPTALRYADDIAIFCNSRDTARTASLRMRRLLIPAGYRFKPPVNGESTVHELRHGALLNWLGFEIGLNDEGNLILSVPEKSWAKLFDRLERAHRCAPQLSNQEAAREVGFWINELGPAYADVRRDEVFDRIFGMAAKFGIEISAYQSQLSAGWRRAYKRWRQIDRDAERAAAAAADQDASEDKP